MQYEDIMMCLEVVHLYLVEFGGKNISRRSSNSQRGRLDCRVYEQQGEKFYFQLEASCSLLLLIMIKLTH